MIQKAIFLCLLVSISSQTSYAQSFEAVSFPDITDTPSASRSANFIDVNGDGWDDIFITNGPASGANNMLYLNNQNGTFTTIVTDDIVSDNDRSDGASFADADNDGGLDAFVVTFGAGGVGKKNYFYRNNGDNTFTYEPTIAMGIPLTYSEMCLWIDANNDQNLDLYITNSVGSLSNLYFENQGDGSFQQNTNLTITDNALPSRSIDWIDYDGDGDCDLYVTNENGEDNALFRNDGIDHFTQITNSVITQGSNNSAGSSWADIDNDGDFDLFVANYGNSGEANQLYINDSGVFTEATGSVIADPTTNSFGSSFADVDNDGDLDLFVCNAYLASQTTNFLYINDGSANFSLDTNSDLANHQGWTFGCAFGDYDNDGWLDALLANNLNDNESNAVYRNTGTGNNWVKLNCEGTDSNYSAMGAVVVLTATINGVEVSQTRKIASASGYCSQNSYAVHFGLGDATTIDELRVSWPAGTVELFTNVTINEMNNIIEGEGNLGVADVNKDRYTLYPNPARDTIAITGNGSPAVTEVHLINMEGKTVSKIELPNAVRQRHTFTIDLSSLLSGIYLCQLLDASGSVVFSEKIIKK